MKETLLKIVKDSLEDDLEWFDYEIDQDEDGEDTIRVQYISEKVGGLFININISLYFNCIKLWIMPEKYNKSSFWENPCSYIYLNEANLKVGDYCKMWVHAGDRKIFMSNGVPLTFGEVLTHKHAVSGAIRKLIIDTERGIQYITDAAISQQ